MVRKNPNPTTSAVLVTDKLLDEARARAAAAAVRVREAEHADPASPGWDSEYASAAAAVQAATRRVEALERLRAVQLERGGRREATVKAAAKDLESIAAGLSATRDAVAAAAREHLRTLVALEAASEAHNALLARSRDRVAELGLRVRDDLVDLDQEHGEGVMDGPGVRAGGIDWLPIPSAGVVAHAMRAVFGRFGPRHPLAEVGRYLWRAHEIGSRGDGLRLPGVSDVGAVLPPAPARLIARAAEVERPPAAAVADDRTGYLPGRRARRLA